MATSFWRREEERFSSSKDPDVDVVDDIFNRKETLETQENDVEENVEHFESDKDTSQSNRGRKVTKKTVTKTTLTKTTKRSTSRKRVKGKGHNSAADLEVPTFETEETDNIVRRSQSSQDFIEKEHHPIKETTRVVTIQQENSRRVPIQTSNLLSPSDEEGRSRSKEPSEEKTIVCLTTEVAKDKVIDLKTTDPKRDREIFFSTLSSPSRSPTSTPVHVKITDASKNDVSREKLPAKEIRFEDNLPKYRSTSPLFMNSVNGNRRSLPLDRNFAIGKSERTIFSPISNDETKLQSPTSSDKPLILRSYERPKISTPRITGHGYPGKSVILSKELEKSYDPLKQSNVIPEQRIATIEQKSQEQRNSQRNSQNLFHKQRTVPIKLESPALEFNKTKKNELFISEDDLKDNDQDWPLRLLVSHHHKFPSRDGSAIESKLVENAKIRVRRLIYEWKIGYSLRATETGMRKENDIEFHGTSRLYTVVDKFDFQYCILESD